MKRETNKIKQSAWNRIKRKFDLFHVSCFTFHEKGFTLLESLVAVAILTVGISTAALLVVQSIQVGGKIQKRIVAAHLAQEGIEVIRNIRDSNWLSGSNWIANINTAGAAGCVDYDDVSIDTSCDFGRNLLFDGSHYEYSSQLSIFSRTASTTLLNVGAPDEKLWVEVNVSCGQNCNVKLDEYLYDWK